MTTKVEPDGALLARINAALSFATRCCIESMEHLDPRRQRGVDFSCIDSAIAACDELLAMHGADTPLPGQHGATPAGLRAQVLDVLAAAAPYRPAKLREARRA